jgi:STE24 endopeptidase
MSQTLSTGPGGENSEIIGRGVWKFRIDEESVFLDFRANKDYVYRAHLTPRVPGVIVSRIMLLVVIVIWMCRSAAPRWVFPLDSFNGAMLFVGGLLLVVLFLGLWSRTVAFHLHGNNLHRSLRRFHNSILVARVLIPVWFAVAVFVLGWGQVVDSMLGPLSRWPVELPGMLIGTFPAFAAWMALWWAQFPADRALREQTQLVAFNEDLPVHLPTGFGSYFLSHLRLQLLFTVVPVALILLVHDLAAVGLLEIGGLDLRRATTGGSSERNAELVIQLVSIGLVVLFAPEVLRRVLQTQPLAPSPLRYRLEELCRRTGLKYRDILLWRTDHNMGNAAVMGVVPQMRYILLSDVLLETMTDYQIEAVFAHEIGHVKHWHMGWYSVLIATLVLLCFGPGQVIEDRLHQSIRSEWLVGTGYFAAIGGFFLVFGYLSRWFERQADVFAARTIERPDGSSPHVGPVGAAAFTSALHRVAVVNNIPLAAKNFTHGSIAERMQYLNTLSSDPTRTLQFDRRMAVMFAALLVTLIVCVAWVVVAWSTPKLVMFQSFSS